MKFTSLAIFFGILACSFLPVHAQRIAVIGGALSGSFFTKYLVDHDNNCSIDSITVFESVPVKGHIKPTEVVNEDWQGSRVASIQLEDGSVVEVGASIAYKGFHLIIDMLKNDPEIQIGPPFNLGTVEDNGLRTGFAINDGPGRWPLSTSNMSGLLVKLLLMWRYNFDLINVKRATDHTLSAFADLKFLLDSTDPETFYASPDEIWDALGLLKVAHNSFDMLLDLLKVHRDVSGLRRLIPYQGSLRNELLLAANLNNYNQNLSEVNGLVGLGTFAASSGGLFSIRGGNYQIILSAFRQAAGKSAEHCGGKNQVQHVSKRVTTVVGSMEGLRLFSNEEPLGIFDIVVHATPLQQSQINFYIQSHMDESVLLPMPMNGLVNAHEEPSEEGNSLLPDAIPDSARRRYRQVVTTIVGNATLNTKLLQISKEALPRSIMMTSNGKDSFFNITTISQIRSDGVFKVFSDNSLDRVVLERIFGKNVVVKYDKVWGGPHGGATPDYQGTAGSSKFLLYDGAVGLEGYTKSGALYYPNAMEQSSLSCIEISAIGAKAVAKLVARRLSLIVPAQETVYDEL